MRLERAPFTPWTGLSLSGALGGVRRPVGHESIRFHPFGKCIDSSRRNFETQLPKMIRLITFGPTTAGRKELMRRRGGDRRHPHLLRAPIITFRPFDPSRPKAGPNLVQKHTANKSGKRVPFAPVWCRNSRASTTRPFTNDPFDYVWHRNSRSRQARR